MIRLSAGSHQFRIHHDAGSATASIRERVHLGDDEHHEDGAVQRAGEPSVDLKTLGESAFH